MPEDNMPNIERGGQGREGFDPAINKEAPKVDPIGSSLSRDTGDLTISVDKSIPSNRDEAHGTGEMQSQNPRLELNRQGNFVLSPAGGPDFATPNQYDARLGGGATAGRPPAGGVPPVDAPGSGQEPQGHRLRNILVSTGIGSTIAAVGTAAALILARGGGSGTSGEQHNPNSGSNGGAPTLKIETPDSTPPAGISATTSPTEAPTTPVTHEVEGQYKTVAEMPISDGTKETINNMLEGSKVQIITDNIIIANENGLETRTESISPVDVTKTQKVPASSLESIGLNTTDFPNEAVPHTSTELLNLFGELGKFMIWESQAKSGKTFEQYQAEEAQGVLHPFKVMSYGADGLAIGLKEVSGKNPIVVKNINEPYSQDNNTMPIFAMSNQGLAFYYKEVNDVVELGIWAQDPLGGSDPTPTTSSPGKLYRYASNLTDAVDSLTDTGIQTAIFTPGKTEVYQVGAKVNEFNTLHKYIIPIKKENPTFWEGIFTVNGTLLKLR